MSMCPHCSGKLFLPFEEYLQMKLVEKSKEKLLTIDSARSCFKFYNIPKKLKEPMLKGMEMIRLLKINKGVIQIINCKPSNDEYENINRLTRRNKQVCNILSDKEGFFDF